MKGFLLDMILQTVGVLFSLISVARSAPSLFILSAASSLSFCLNLLISVFNSLSVPFAPASSLCGRPLCCEEVLSGETLVD